MHADATTAGLSRAGRRAPVPGGRFSILSDWLDTVALAVGAGVATSVVLVLVVLLLSMSGSGGS